MIYRIRDRFDRDVYKLTAASILVLIAVELSFTLYVDPYGLSNLSGHLLQLVAFYLLYRAFIQTALEKPYSFLLHEAKERESELERLAITDRLTGLFNYGYFQDQLNVEIGRKSRYGRVFSLLMIDVDDFKNLNDSYGHECGDRALEDIARIIMKGLRKIDIAARYGGEEFVIILPETDIQSASEAAERIRANVADFLFQNDTGKSTLKITVSIGVSEVLIAEETSTVIIKAADDAMYRAKTEGKNQIALAAK